MSGRIWSITFVIEKTDRTFHKLRMFTDPALNLSWLKALDYGARRLTQELGPRGSGPQSPMVISVSAIRQHNITPRTPVELRIIPYGSFETVPVPNPDRQWASEGDTHFGDRTQVD